MEAKQDGEVAKTYNARLRARLAEFKDAEGLKLGALARQIGTNEAAVSRYLDGHPLGDVATLEARVLDFLEAFARRRSWDELCFDPEAVAIVIDMVWDHLKEQYAALENAVQGK